MITVVIASAWLGCVQEALKHAELCRSSSAAVCWCTYCCSTVHVSCFKSDASRNHAIPTTYRVHTNKIQISNFNDHIGLTPTYCPTNTLRTTKARMHIVDVAAYRWHIRLSECDPWVDKQAAAHPMPCMFFSTERCVGSSFPVKC